MNQQLTQSAAQSGNALVLAAASRVTSEQSQYLTFMLNAEVFAIGILAIKEIIEYGNVTPVPLMPRAVRGVINLRGAVVPVMDLAARLGKPESHVTKRTCIVIVEVQTGEERHDVGVIVDAVNAVLDIAGNDIEPPPAFGARIPRSFIQGMGKVAGSFVILLDVDLVLSLEEHELLVAHVARPLEMGEPA